GYGCFLPHLLVCTAGRSLGTASARPFSTVSVHRAIARLIENRGPCVPYPVHLYHDTVQHQRFSASLIERVAPRRSHRVSLDCNRNVLTERRQHKKGKSHPLTCAGARAANRPPDTEQGRVMSLGRIGFLNSRTLIPRLGEAMRRGFGGRFDTTAPVSTGCCT